MVWKTTIKYQNPKTKAYIMTPTITRLPDGRLLAAHDLWGPGVICGDHYDRDDVLATVYESTDNGESFQPLTHIYNMFQPQLFVHRGKVYMMGQSRAFGDLVIRRSEDGGYTWSYPRNEKTGLLVRGGEGGRRQLPNYLCNMPVLEHKGRLYVQLESLLTKEGPWRTAAGVISCDADADLLDASNWRMSNHLELTPEMIPQSWYEKAAKVTSWSADPEGWLRDHVDWIEGNIVVGPDGELCDVLRVGSEPLSDLAAIVRIHDEGRRVTFSQDDFIDMPGGTHKFVIKYDEVSGLYWTLSNKNTVPGAAWQRNILTLSNSKDLRHWQVVKVLMEDDQGLPLAESLNKTSFSYVDWIFDGEDILYVVRSGYNNPKSFHDTNYMVFDKVENFRQYVTEIALDDTGDVIVEESGVDAVGQIQLDNKEKNSFADAEQKD